MDHHRYRAGDCGADGRDGLIRSDVGGHGAERRAMALRQVRHGRGIAADADDPLPRLDQRGDDLGSERSARADNYRQRHRVRFR